MQGYNIVILKIELSVTDYKYRILLTMVLTGSRGYYGCTLRVGVVYLAAL